MGRSVNKMDHTQIREEILCLAYLIQMLLILHFHYKFQIFYKSFSSESCQLWFLTFPNVWHSHGLSHTERCIRKQCSAVKNEVLYYKLYCFPIISRTNVLILQLVYKLLRPGTITHLFTLESSGNPAWSQFNQAKNRQLAGQAWCSRSYC